MDSLARWPAGRIPRGPRPLLAPTWSVSTMPLARVAVEIFNGPAAHSLECSCKRAHARHSFARVRARSGLRVPGRGGSSSHHAQIDGQRSV